MIVSGVGCPDEMSPFFFLVKQIVHFAVAPLHLLRSLASGPALVIWNVLSDSVREMSLFQLSTASRPNVMFDWNGVPFLALGVFIRYKNNEV